MSTTHRSQQRRRSGVAVLVAAALLLSACSGDDATTSTTPTGSTTPSTVPGDGSTSARPSRLLGVSLSQGESQQGAIVAVPLVDGQPLDDATVQQIEARLPAWDPAGAQTQEFQWPGETRPRPRAGETVDVPFPPATEVPSVDVPVGPLRVLRFQPEGDVPVAPYVSITFDQPMVPLGTVGQLAEADVPATITPELEGHWQWIGTRTLRFDHTSDRIDRLPMATAYRVEVPAGTVSATGGVLADTVSWEFATPPVTLQSFAPDGDSMTLQPVFVAAFDQLIAPAAVLATVTVRAGGADVALRLATAAEVEADETARSLTSGWPEGRWLAFRPVEPMPTDSAVTIDIGPGTPSAEGPVRSTARDSRTGRTYAPLRVLRATCGWDDTCPPGSDLVVELNNPLRADSVDPAAVLVDPALAGRQVFASGSTITVRGATAARTTYRVTLPADVTDVFGQALGSAESVSVTIGSAQPALGGVDGPLTTLDPFADSPTLSVTSVNHDRLRVRAYSVSPDDWASYSDWWIDREGRSTPPAGWTQVTDSTTGVDGVDDVVTETSVDLADAVAATGHAVVIVEPVPAVDSDSEDYWANRPIVTWVQRTSLGVDAFSDNSDLVVWTTDLRTGAPRQGVSLTTLPGSRPAGTTDASGLATLPLPRTIDVVVATDGDDVAILPAGMYGETWSSRSLADEARWFVFDDRHLYRPGETVSIKGWVRRLTLTGDAQLALLDADARVEYTVSDSFGNELVAGSTDVGWLGGFDLTVDLPAETNLGQAAMQFTLVGEPGLTSSGYYHSFEVQEFRRPEFEVTARAESQPPFVSSRPATVAVEAEYYAGGPLAAAPVDWLVSTSEASYAPPGWDEFTFGIWQPWWYDSGGPSSSSYSYASGYDTGYPGCCGPYDEPAYEQFTGTTDAAGEHYLQIDFTNPEGDRPDLPVSVTAEATVTDVNRQAWASRTALLVHPAEVYVGLRGTRAFVRAGDPLDIDAIVTDVDGAAVPGTSLTVTAARLDSVVVNGQWTEVEIDVQTCTLTSGADATRCTFTTDVAGTYRVTSVVADGKGGHNRTELTRWVAGADTRPSRTVDQQQLTLVPDLPEYQPGDTAEVLVQSPFATGHGLLTVSRNGIRSTVTFVVEGGSAVLTVPVTDDDVPGLDLTIEVVGSAPRVADDGSALPDAPDRPAYAVGGLSLAVSTLSRTLTVEVAPRASVVAPGASTQLDVTVTDAAGRPVDGAEVAVVMVDEAVLAAGGYTIGDPLSAFYAPLWSMVNAVYGRQSIVLADPDQYRTSTEKSVASTTPAAAPADSDGGEPTAMPGAPESAAGDDTAATVPGATAIDVRTDFDALALFAPEVTTAADGTAVVEVDLPDNLTRYRITAVAVDGADRFGRGESTVTARLPVSVRPSAPRFANFGDSFELPVVVQNQTDQPLVVDVVLQTSNLVVQGPAGTRVTVPANDRVEVRFPVTTASAGTASFRVAAVTADAADAAFVELPVYTPATAEAFATYGVVDNGAVLQPLLAPTAVVPQFGGLEITTSSTSLQALTDAVLYIADYPYRSSDAMASRIISIAALREVLEAFDAEGLPSPAELDAAVETDIAGLVALQNDDGGFPYWRHYGPSEPFNSLQAAHALVLAGQEGYVVPADTLARALAHLADIESYIPAEYGEEARDTISAYALYVRDLAGERDAAKAEQLYQRRGDALRLDALAWLWPSLDDTAIDTEIERRFQNAAVETAGAANFSTDYGDDGYLLLHSDRRTDGIVLDALITQRPDSDLIPKVVAGLLANQTRGRWDNVQENSFILLALQHYYDEFEAVTPDFVARVWLGERFAGEHAFTGRETDRARLALPMTEVIAAGDTDIVLGKEGAGRLYYRLGLRYAPADLRLDPLDRGFVVDRVYEAVDDPADVTRDADGTWRIRAGARVRVKLTMVAESQRTHVALVDPLPAGLEILNPELAVTTTVPPEGGDNGESGDGADPAGDWWWWGTWYDHQNARDDRAEAFATLLPAGTYSYSYVARATTPGTFVVPPTRAEEMYAPETFGRTATDTVVVAD